MQPESIQQVLCRQHLVKLSLVHIYQKYESQPKEFKTFIIIVTSPRKMTSTVIIEVKSILRFKPTAFRISCLLAAKLVSHFASTLLASAGCSESPLVGAGVGLVRITPHNLGCRLLLETRIQLNNLHFGCLGEYIRISNLSNTFVAQIGSMTMTSSSQTKEAIS